MPAPTHNCKGCPDRHYGCHGKCESYKAFAEERKEILKRARDDNSFDANFQKYCQSLKKRTKK